MEATAREGPQYQASSAWLVTYLNRQGDWLEKTRGNLVVAATVIATMSFQLMVNPPGGVWQSDNCSFGDETVTCKGIAGTSVLEHEVSKRLCYVGIVISSVMSFTASLSFISLSLILLAISGFRLRNRLIMATMVMFMVAVLWISAAFYFALALVHYEDRLINYIGYLYLGFWVFFPVLVILIQVVRFLWWLIRFICCCRQSTPWVLPLTPSPAP